MNSEQFDKKIDELARKAADGHGLPFREASWEKMELLLDKEERKRRFVFWWFWLPALVLLFGAAGFWFVASNNKKTVTVHENKEAIKGTIVASETKPTSNTQQQTLPTDKPSPHIATTRTGTGSDPSTGAAKAKQPSSTPSTPVAVDPMQAPVQQPQHLLDNREKRSYISITASTIKKIQSAKQQPKRGMLQKNVPENSQDGYGSDIMPIQKEEGASAISPMKFAKGQLAHIDLHLSGKLPSFNLPSSADTPKAAASTPKNKQQGSSRFEFFVLGSADLTSVSFRQIQQVSTGYGIGAAFHLSKKWSVSAAFAVSEKLYKGDSNSYKTPSYLGSRYYLTDVDAKCRVFDISLNAQYAFKQGKKGTWLGVAGLSSYIMNQEDYDYTYIYLNMPYKYPYSYANESQHYFSVLNLAAAYRSKLARNLSWQLSPYLKVPLTGIGHGKVNLYSTGLQASIHFRKER